MSGVSDSSIPDLDIYIRHVFSIYIHAYATYIVLSKRVRATATLCAKG